MTELPPEPTESGDSSDGGAEPAFDVPEAAAPIGASAETPAREVAIWLTAEDFATITESSPAVRPPGPGLPESLGWIAGILVLQVVGVLTAAVFVERENLLGVFAVVQAVLVFGIAGAAFLRLGRERVRMLPLGRIPWQHLLIIFVMVLPMFALSGQLVIAGQFAWRSLIELFPALPKMDDASSMNLIAKLGREPAWVLLLLFAVAPAIAEELAFRGVIGRGLVARWGIPAGVVLTTLMFAAMHVYPPQVFALLPLSMYMHLIYLSSRSFWAPMLVHFLHNAFAVLALKTIVEQNDQLPQAREMNEPVVSGVIFVGAGFCVATLLILAWKTRVSFLRDDGSEWNPGYASVEHPPAEAFAVRQCQPAGTATWVWAGCGLVMFVFSLVFVAVMKDQGWNV